MVKRSIFWLIRKCFNCIDEPFINSFVFGGKAGIEIQPTEKIKFKITSSYITVPGAEKTAVYQFNQGYQGETGKRNRLGTNPNFFANNFNLFDASLKLSYDIFPNLPITIFSDFVNNFGAADKNKGYLIGASIQDTNSLSNPTTPTLYIIYTNIRQDF